LDTDLKLLQTQHREIKPYLMKKDDAALKQSKVEQHQTREDRYGPLSYREEGNGLQLRTLTRS
jgi:hypothetical protein